MKITRLKPRKEVVLVSIGLFLLFIMFQLIYMGENTSFVDENDNFMGGMIVAHGGDVYKDFCSQHMPVMYYLSALMYFLGARTVYHYRILFSIFTSVLWIAMYFRYRRTIGPMALVFGPIIYCCFIASGDLTMAAVMADKAQAYGNVIILLELICFVEDKERKISVATCIWISFAVFLSFGSSFVAIFCIFAAGMLVLCIEVRDRLIQRKKLLLGDNGLFSKYWRFIGIVALPFIVLLLWYLATGNIKNFGTGAYIMNTVVYSDYVGGYGSDPIAPLIQAIPGFFVEFKRIINELSSFSFENIWKFLILFANITFIIYYFSKDKLVGIGFAYFIAQSAPRGYFSFHAISHFMVSAYIAGWIVQKCYVAWIQNKQNYYVKTLHYAALGVAIILMMPGLIRFGDIQSSILNIATDRVGTTSIMIRKLTEPNEKVASLVNIAIAEELVDADRCVLNGATSTPWTYRVWGDKELDLIKETKPRLVLFNPNYAVWGHKITEYAKDTCEYIYKHYENVGGSEYPDFWVRRDYAEEAAKIMGLAS